MPLKVHLWNLLLDRPALRHTLDELRGYCLPAAARATLCQQYAVSDTELTALQKLTHQLYRPAQRQDFRPLGRPRGKAARDGFDLLLDTPRLRAALAAGVPLEGLALTRLREKFKLSRPELVAVLNAHADLLARP